MDRNGNLGFSKKKLLAIINRLDDPMRGLDDPMRGLDDPLSAILPI